MLRDSANNAKTRAAFPSFPHLNVQQWVHTLCVTAMLPTSMGGGHGKVAIIDTEGGFRPEKIGPIAERFGVKGEVSPFFSASLCFFASALHKFSFCPSFCNTFNIVAGCVTNASVNLNLSIPFSFLL